MNMPGAQGLSDIVAALRVSHDGKQSGEAVAVSAHWRD